jgi:hypothetical protein
MTKKSLAIILQTNPKQTKHTNHEEYTLKDMIPKSLGYVDCGDILVHKNESGLFVYVNEQAIIQPVVWSGGLELRLRYGPKYKDEPNASIAADFVRDYGFGANPDEIKPSVYRNSFGEYELNFSKLNKKMKWTVSDYIPEEYKRVNYRGTVHVMRQRNDIERFIFGQFDSLYNYLRKLL